MSRFQPDGGEAGDATGAALGRPGQAVAAADGHGDCQRQPRVAEGER
jgi:hypothetical protein